MPPPWIANPREPPRLRQAEPLVGKDGGLATSTSSSGALGGWGLGAGGFLPGATGQAISPVASLGIATAWACVKRLAEDHGKLPRRIMRQLPDGGMVEVRGHPLMRVLRTPNPWQTASQFWAYMTTSLALRGNAYAAVARGRAGEPVALVPLNNDRLTPMMGPGGELYYDCYHAWFGAEPIRLHRDNVIHVRNAVSLDGFTGVSPIAAAPDVFGLGIATQQHGATLFRQGAQVGGMIRHPGRLTKEGRDFLRQEFNGRFSGVQNAHGTVVLDEGMSFEKVTMTNEDAQFLESRQFSVSEICRLFGVPPHKVHDLTHAHYATVEQNNLQYWSDTLQPIGKQYEEESSRVLLFDDERDDLTIAIDYDELMRADRKTRYETDEIGIRSGRLSRNEARISDGMAPNVPQGDEFLQPLNMASTTDGTDPISAADAELEPSDEGT